MSAIPNEIDPGASTTQSPSVTADIDQLRSTGVNELASLLQLGHLCAKLLKATCVSEQLSKSYSENSLRFTCQNGHNFFLSVAKLRETYTTLTTVGNDPEVVARCTWCNKCAKYYGKVKAICVRQGCDVISGLHQKRITLNCRKSSHSFTISYSKKFE